MGYSKEVFRQAVDEIRGRRQAAVRIETERRAEIAAKIPEIAEIGRELAGTAMAVTRAVASDPDNAVQAVEELRKQNLRLRERRAALLRAAGYPEDYLAPPYTCAKCSDTGHTPGGMCSCLRELLRKTAYAQLGAVSPAADCTFGNFRLDVYPETAENGVRPRARMAENLAVCKRYAASFGHGSGSLLLMGRTGLGKTHLSLAVASEVTGRGFGVVYTPAQKLIDRLEANKFSYAPENRGQYASDLESALECDLLVIDDLGAEFATSFSQSILCHIVNTRLCEGRPAIISTNLDLGQIEERYTQRMLSRLAGGFTVLKFLGRDIRLGKKSL